MSSHASQFTAPPPELPRTSQPRSIVVLDADRDSGERLARRWAALGWPIDLHYARLTPSVVTLIVDIWDGGGVVRALPDSDRLEGYPPLLREPDLAPRLGGVKGSS